MRYQISPAQKALLVRIGGNVNFEGDDNDFSCYLSNFATDLFIAGDVDTAYECWLNDPLACYGVTRESWYSHMLTIIRRHAENQKAMDAHARRMERAWN